MTAGKVAETWTETAAVMRTLEWMGGIRIEEIGDTRHDSATEHNSLEGTDCPSVQKKTDKTGG